MTYALPLPPVPSAAIAGSEDRFALRRIFCVGRNYAEHAREMGHDPDREPPFFFMKPADALRGDGDTIAYPPQTDDLHYEGELVVAIGTGGRDIPVETAREHVWGYALGNDLTRRDMQGVAKKMGRPWDLAKGFDGSAVVGPIHPVSVIGHLSEEEVLTSMVNGEIRQSSALDAMIWPIPDVIAFLSQSVELQPGDLIFTGTPAGVGKLNEGDTCVVALPSLGQITTMIGPRA